MQECQHHLVADRRRIRKGATGQAAARLRGAEERRARGRARQRASSSISARLFERSERSERSELRDAPRARVPQGSRRAAPTASLKRCGLPGRAFAAPTLPRHQTPTATATATSNGQDPSVPAQVRREEQRSPAPPAEPAH